MDQDKDTHFHYGQKGVGFGKLIAIQGDTL